MTTTSDKGAHPWRAVLRRRTAKTARWLHIYLSMVSFGIVLFFAASGLTVNHPDWFAGSVRTRQAHGTVDPTLLAAHNAVGPENAVLIQDMRRREHLHGAVEDVRVDETEVSFSYRAPGYSADVVVERQSGSYSVTEVRNGFVAVVNDLHKGRDAGKVWSRLIDASALLLTLVSLTGLLILLFLYKRRTSGLILAAAGLAFCALLYQVFVP